LTLSGLEKITCKKYLESAKREDNLIEAFSMLNVFFTDIILSSYYQPSESSTKEKCKKASEYLLKKIASQTSFKKRSKINTFTTRIKA